MARRIHVPKLSIGEIPLDPAQAHHARDVLRLASGTAVDVFDDSGATATGELLHRDSAEVMVRVESINAASVACLQWIVAAAVPKGERADWMVEKLSELGASAFIPLAAARSVVLPEGKGKRERWMRIATEAAKQSRRAGVMRIEELTRLEVALKQARPTELGRFHSGTRFQPVSGTQDHGLETRATNTSADPETDECDQAAWFLATEVPATPIAEALALVRDAGRLTLFIGPEGGWTDQEITAFVNAGVSAVRLTASILRIETAAVAAGAVVASILA